MDEGEPGPADFGETPGREVYPRGAPEGGDATDTRAGLPEHLARRRLAGERGRERQLLLPLPEQGRHRVRDPRPDHRGLPGADAGALLLERRGASLDPDPVLPRSGPGGSAPA